MVNNCFFYSLEKESLENGCFHIHCKEKIWKIIVFASTARKRFRKLFSYSLQRKSLLPKRNQQNIANSEWIKKNGLEDWNQFL